MHANADLRSEPNDKSGQYLSSKVLTEVVEVPIGVSYVDRLDSQERQGQSLAGMRLFLSRVP